MSSPARVSSAVSGAEVAVDLAGMASPSSTDNTRPSKLSYARTRVVEGRHYIDTSDESGCTNDDVIMNEPDTQTQQQQVSFVAADLNEQIRMSSPSVSGQNSAATTSSSASPYPPLVPDAHAVLELEAHARHLAGELNQVMTEFAGSLAGITDLSLEYVSVYDTAVHQTCDQVDQCIKSMYQMVAKAEELSIMLKSLPRLAQQIKEVRRMLDLFESHMQKSIA